jgi:Sulfatase
MHFVKCVVKAPNSLGYAGGLRGGKHTYYEGGTRVPFLVRWPGHVPAGRVDNVSVMSALDWFTTVSRLAGAPYRANLVEGEDMSDVWLGATRSRINPLFFREILPDGPVVIRYGKWKFHNRTRELYDLAKDPFEQTNLVKNRPDVVAELMRAADDWVATLPQAYTRKPSNLLANFSPTRPVQRVALPKIADAFPSSNKGNGSTNTARPARQLATWISLVVAMIGVMAFLNLKR